MKTKFKLGTLDQVVQLYANYAIKEEATVDIAYIMAVVIQAPYWFMYTILEILCLIITPFTIHIISTLSSILGYT